MPYIPKWYEYKPLPFYPHMGQRDAELWNKFVITNNGIFQRVIYDMRVGEIEPYPPGTPKNIADAWQDLGRWRVDVVAENSDALFTIEVRPRALADALGNARGYAVLYIHEHKPDKVIVPLVITDFILPNTRMVARERHIEIWTPDTFNQST